MAYSSTSNRTFHNLILKHYTNTKYFPEILAIGLLGDPIPRSCIIPEGIGPAIVKADCIRFKPNFSLALTEFLNYAINVQELRSQATESVHGVARPRLNLTQIKNFAIPLPPLAEQHEISAVSDRCLACGCVRA